MLLLLLLLLLCCWAAVRQRQGQRLSGLDVRTTSRESIKLQEPQGGRKS